MNCKIYKSLNCFFILILSYLIFEVESFTPAGRLAHSSVLVVNRIYFFGGVDDQSNDLSEVFYLDLSKPFDMATPSWKDMSATSAIPFRSAFATTASTNNDNNPIIYLIGGLTRDQNNVDTFISLIHAFNPKSKKWNTPIIKGKEPERRRNIQAVVDDVGKIYVFGGKTDNSLGSEIIQLFNDIAIFNTKDLNWSQGPIVNAPLKRDLYTATH
ncbi:19557_t:CDS:2 [Funneliformis geosporum]|uniref:19557_t:CDS:1 n=1 Tax=Funneliformis geosporum TaxID=1117311 RepID=A0A9W4SVK1_9GLOM|nr:19557_t:CDS:2 [Funneliformis geosporum]